MDMKSLHIAAFILVVVGGINWGLWGLFNVNIVNALLSGIPMIERLVYVLVGISAVYLFAQHKMDCKMCSSKKK